ncbi:lysozyme [Methylobacterium planeticum]|uniref:Lysozyme n=1 Tax=Methylobacterium planeticum TaxID=2615211 RepID=A0A6N6MTJ4_9HYPH|nr:lysozyme [Methylobacterium planeticum]KAB1072836.1 lysozyme [Methylobacterium planeticum]
MELSAIGRAVLVAREGVRLDAYRDAVGIWTIGVGHTSAAGPPAVRAGLRLTPAEADALFGRDVARTVALVAEAVPPGLPEHAFDALVSLCFNIGPAAFLRSTVLRRLRLGDRAGAGAAILLWDRPACVIPRRAAEADQFRTPYGLALPRARRNDPGPIPRPGGVAPPLAPQRRPIPRGTGAGAAGPPSPPRPRSPSGPGLLARLWAALRARLAG